MGEKKLRLEEITRMSEVPQTNPERVSESIEPKKSYIALFGVDVNSGREYYDTYGVEFKENLQKLIHYAMMGVKLDVPGLKILARDRHDRQVLQYDTDREKDDYSKIALQIKTCIEEKIAEVYNGQEIKPSLSRKEGLDRTNVTVRVGIAVVAKKDFDNIELYESLECAVRKAKEEESRISIRYIESDSQLH